MRAYVITNMAQVGQTWVWLIDFHGFGMKHAMEIKTAVAGLNMYCCYVCVCICMCITYHGIMYMYMYGFGMKHAMEIKTSVAGLNMYVCYACVYAHV